jgi:phosphoserine phosphatase
MTKIIAVRHAESIANTQGIYQGQTYDTGLSSLGKKQAKALAARLLNEKIDKLICSPLKRTIQTALEISKSTGVKIEKDRRIIETDHGAWEGKKIDWIKKHYSVKYKTWQEKPYEAVFPEGESFRQTDERIKKFLLFEKFYGITLLVTHDNIVRLLVCLAKSLSVNKMWDFKLNPAAITEFEVIQENGEKKLVLTKLNDDKHLKRFMSDISQHAL